MRRSRRVELTVELPKAASVEINTRQQLVSNSRVQLHALGRSKNRCDVDSHCLLDMEEDLDRFFHAGCKVETMAVE